MLPGSKCTDTEKARWAWHGWHLCLMLPLPARRSRRALVHCLKMLSYSAPPSAHYNLVLTYNALPITKYCTAGACLRLCPGSPATCPGRGTTLGRKTWALTSSSSIITGPWNEIKSSYSPHLISAFFKTIFVSLCLRYSSWANTMVHVFRQNQPSIYWSIYNGIKASLSYMWANIIHLNCQVSQPS